jgi:hypothetical protein
MSTPNDRDFFSTLGQPGGGVNQPVDGDAVDAGEPKHQATNGIHHDAPAPDTDTGHVNGLQQARPPHFGAMSSSGPAGLNPPTGPQPQLPQPPHTTRVKAHRSGLQENPREASRPHGQQA